MNRATVRIVIALGAAGWAGCLGSTDKHRVDCGDGDNVVFEGADFCVYAAPLIIEGFDCPEAVPFQFPGSDGAVICGPAPDLPQDDVDAIIGLWQQASTPDASGGDALPAPDTWIGGDSWTGADTASADIAGPDTEPGPNPSLCASTLAEPSFIVPLAGTCSVTEQCGDGPLVSCGGESMFCYCDYGDIQCIPASSCVALEQPVGAACDPAAGTKACAESLYCPEDTGTCATTPTPCSEIGCYTDLECTADGPGRCHGADPVTAEAGWCAPAPASSLLCRDADDCGPGWTCAGAGVDCDACGCDATRDSFGYCTAPAADGAAALKLDGDHPRASDPPVATWWNGGGETIWIGCSSWRVMVRDESTWEWVGGLEEVGCSQTLRPIYAGQALATGAIDIGQLDPGAWRWVRVEGSYYTGCTGTDATSCEAGPTTVESERLLLRQ